jgi:hypothetical protein
MVVVTTETSMTTRLDPMSWLESAIRTAGVGLSQVGGDLCVTFDIDDDGAIHLTLGAEAVDCATLGEATVLIREYAADTGAKPGVVGPIDGFAGDLEDLLGEAPLEEVDLDEIAERWGLDLAFKLEGDPPHFVEGNDVTFALDAHGTWWRVWMDDRDAVAVEPIG